MILRRLDGCLCISLTRKKLFETMSYLVLARQVRKMHMMSKIFQPVTVVPKDAQVKHEEVTSRSQKLMLDMGFIKHAHHGTLCLLPLGLRSFNKLVAIVDRELAAVGAQKILLPTLTSGELWKTSGRWKSSGAELFRLQDRHSQDLVLSPTHEEAITNMLASLGQISHKQLPLMLYQISPKFRDELKPRSGLLRAREFIMKDLYTFDADLSGAERSYEIIREAYHRIFKQLGVKYLTVQGDASSMGGTASEEFHIPAEVGEDQLTVCSDCGFRANAEMITADSRACPSCGKSNLQHSKGIEVGHCFILGTRYTKSFKATCLGPGGKPQLIYMGCHGLGISRILAATAEALSTSELLRWPLALAPFTACIIQPKDGSKEMAAAESGLKLYSALDALPSTKNDILLDDRGSLTIGRRFRDCNQSGYPFIIVAGKTATGPDPEFEVHDTGEGSKMQLKFSQVVDLVREKTASLVVR